MKILRDDQVSVIDRLRECVREGLRRIVMQAPTGFGKTLVASTITDSSLDKGRRVLFIVPALSLVDQTVEMFYRQGIDKVGVIQAQHEMTDWSKPVQIATVQTLQNRGMPQANVIMIDEVHRWFSYYAKMLLLPETQDVPIIGLSATPWTKGLGMYFDRLVVASTTGGLIERGLLSQFKVFAPAVHPDLDGVRSQNTVNGKDYVESELAERMVKPELVADVVDTWLQRADRRPTLCFAVNCAHARVLRERFEAAGVNAGYQDARTTGAERESIKRQFHDGRLEVVCNVGTLTTGVDWDVRCISMCRPTRSEMLFVQIVGRGLRTADGKDHCLILDHSDNHLRLGFVTEIDVAHDGLHSGQNGVANTREGVVALPKECVTCGYIKPPRGPCPNCGAVGKPAKCDIEEANGELAELTATDRKRSKVVEGDKRSVYAGLLWIAKKKGYASGWVSHKYREIFGVWPVGLRFTAPECPAYDLEDFVRRATLNWKRRKQRVEGKENGHANGAMTERDQKIIDDVRKQFLPGTLMTQEDLDVKL